jgi:hypothetical protein
MWCSLCLQRNITDYHVLIYNAYNYMRHLLLKLVVELFSTINRSILKLYYTRKNEQPVPGNCQVTLL